MCSRLPCQVGRVPTCETTMCVVSVFLLLPVWSFSVPTRPSQASSSQLSFEAYYSILPHPSKLATGGEDSYFVHRYALGVADGVGGWGEVGIDPSHFSRALTRGAERAALNGERDPLALMRAGYDAARGVRGSSTFCIVALASSSSSSSSPSSASSLTTDSNNIGNKIGGSGGSGSNVSLMVAANVGDSGFMLVRNDKIVFRSEEQQHSFNFPFQLATVDEGSTIDDAQYLKLDVRPGDIVIVGSDGLFDNIYDDKLLELTTLNHRRDSSSPSALQTLAHELAKLAQRNGMDPTFLSPFASRKEGLIGGKLDDVTVIVAKIVDSSPSAQRQQHRSNDDNNDNNNNNVATANDQFTKNVVDKELIITSENNSVWSQYELVAIIGCCIITGFIVNIYRKRVLYN